MKFELEIEEFRIRTGRQATFSGEPYGAFIVPRHRAPFHTELKIIASSGNIHEGIEWEHVSVSTEKRCPNWPEMCFVKDLFWAEDETVMQLHPPKNAYVNNHEYCLHLWRPLNQTIPLPPQIAVGIPGVTHSQMQAMSEEQRLAAQEKCAAAIRTEAEKL